MTTDAFAQAVERCKERPALRRINPILDRQQYRSAQTARVRAEFHSWLVAQRARALPKSPLGEAVGYALSNWQALMRYTEQGYLAIDNVIASYYTPCVRWRVTEECFISGPGLARSVPGRGFSLPLACYEPAP